MNMTLSTHHSISVFEAIMIPSKKKTGGHLIVPLSQEASGSNTLSSLAPDETPPTTTTTTTESEQGFAQPKQDQAYEVLKQQYKDLQQ
jgi:hypothetical protein